MTYAELITKLRDYTEVTSSVLTSTILDGIIRLIPGVLNSYESAETDSFSHALLDCPHYTRPGSYKGLESPSVLLSGNHKEIEDWKNYRRQKKTRDRRPDLWEKYKKIEDGKKSYE